MPALEDSGLIVPVGRWVIAEACAQSRAWATAVPDVRPLQVMLNLSARQITQADFVDHLRDTIRETGANPETLFLEVDDRAFSNDRGMVWEALRGAKRLGFRLALDDFGAGLTSLRHLHDLELDLLKIDPVYVAGVGNDRRGTAIVQHVIGLAKSLNVITLAEAVETADQVDMLRALDCDLAQGFHFGSPQPAAVITRMLRQPAAPPPATPPTTRTQLVNATAVASSRRLAEAGTVDPSSWPVDPA
jgi:EAL domain-containing protein (putative c-di-GMP-specific phosphodiesterase class I)